MARYYIQLLLLTLIGVTLIREKVQIEKSAHLYNGKEILSSCNKASQQLTQNTLHLPRHGPARPHGLHSNTLPCNY